MVVNGSAVMLCYVMLVKFLTDIKLKNLILTIFNYFCFGRVEMSLSRLSLICHRSFATFIEVQILNNGKVSLALHDASESDI